LRTTTKQRAGAAKKLRKLPAVAAKSVVSSPKRARSPKKVVQSVQDELASLFARGYSIEEVGKELRGAGIEISAGTLRSYAKSATKRAAEAASSPAAPAKRKAATRKAAGSNSGPVSAAPASRKLSTQPAAPAKGRVPGIDFSLAKATFVVRPDTPDSDL
jgi:hypothetical protein